MTKKSYKDALLGVRNPEEPEKNRYPSDDSDFSESDSEVDFGWDPKWKYNPLACMDYSCRNYSYIEQKENASDEEFDELVKDVQEQMMRVMINEIDLARNTSSKK